MSEIKGLALSGRLPAPPFSCIHLINQICSAVTEPSDRGLVEPHKHFQMMVRGVRTEQEERGVQGGQASSRKPRGELEMCAQYTQKAPAGGLLTEPLGHGHLA